MNNRALLRGGEPLGRFDQDGDQITAILVLGMHRVGSSAVTRFFSFLGCTLPRTLLGANPTNPTGHWESDAIRAFNDELLAEAGSTWSDWQPMHADWANSITYRPNLRRAAEVLNSEFGDSPLFVLKDPRICRMASFWLEVLERQNINPVCLLPIRNPLEVAASLEARDGMNPEIGQLLWLRHVLDAEFASRGRRRMFMRYEDLLDDWNGLAGRAGKEMGIVWPRNPAAFAADAANFLTRELRHHISEAADILKDYTQSQWLRDTYAVLASWSHKGEKADDYARLDDIRLAFNEAGVNFARPVNALDRARQDIEEIKRDRHGLAARVFELSAALEEAQPHEVEGLLDQATRRADALEVELGQARQCLAEADLRLDGLVLHMAVADGELDAAKVKNDELAGESGAKSRELMELRDAIVAKDSTIEAIAQDLSLREREIEELKQQMRAGVATRDWGTSVDERTGRDAKEVGPQIASQRHLRDAEGEVAMHRAVADLMRGISGVLSARGKWWFAFLPAFLIRRLKYRALQRKGLFDAQLYRKRYPDVARTGMDPLNHYVLHGLQEGRSRS